MKPLLLAAALALAAPVLAVAQTQDPGLLAQNLRSERAACLAVPGDQPRSECIDRLLVRALQALQSGATVQAPAATRNGQYEQFVRSAKAALARNMRDPSSVQFRNLFVSGKTSPILCGEFNAKNAYGAYVGFKAFFATENPDLQDIEDAKNPGFHAGMRRRFCDDKVMDVE